MSEQDWMQKRLQRMAGYTEEQVTVAGIKRTIRARNPKPKGLGTCFVCEQHHLITHAHHAVEVGFVAKLLGTYGIYGWSPRIATVYLCPNDHAYWHLLRRKGKSDSEAIREIVREMGEEVFYRLIRLGDMEIEARRKAIKEIEEEDKRREASEANFEVRR